TDGVRNLPNRLQFLPHLTGGPCDHKGAGHVVGDEMGHAAIVPLLDAFLEMLTLGSEPMRGKILLILLHARKEGHTRPRILDGLPGIRVRRYKEPTVDLHIRPLLATTGQPPFEMVLECRDRPVGRPDRMAYDAVGDLRTES